MTWYAITTDVNRQRAARKLLRKQGFAAYLPAEVRRAPGKTKRVVLPLMRYVFVKAPGHTSVRALWMHAVSETKYVRCFVTLSRDAGPMGISGEMIDQLKQRVDSVVAEKRANRSTRSLRRGKAAVIKAGHFVGKKGTITWLRGDRAKLEAFISGSMRVFEVKTENLEAA